MSKLKSSNQGKDEPGGQEKPVTPKMPDWFYPQIKEHGQETINPPELRKHILEGKTEFGRFIRPLVRRLALLPEGRQTENMETLELIYDFMKGKDRELSKMKFTREDALFLVTDKIGSLIRRPVVHTHFAQTMDETLEATTDDEKAVREVFIKGLRANAWSRFVADAAGIRDQIKQKYPSEQVFVDYMENASRFEELMTKCPIFAYGMVRQAVELAVEFYDKYAKPLEPEYSMDKELARTQGRDMIFLTDPGHAFGVKADMNLYDSYANELATHNYRMMKEMKLIRETSFMLVEDNPSHTIWARLLDDVKKLSYYRPPKKSESSDALTRKYEDRGVYSSAERALEVIKQTGKPPDILLADIELGSGMNGIELVRKLHKEHPQAIILMVYSSNPGPYDLEGLKNEGVIAGAWDKKEFKPHLMIDTINQELKRRSAKGN